jgi:phage repressor protein C with HTH and peptisase S24 domain
VSIIATPHHPLLSQTPPKLQGFDGHGQTVWQGDSMAPTIQPGDVITVDLSVKAFGPDGIYAIGFDDWAGCGFLLRRLTLRPVDGLINVTCDHPSYERSTLSRSAVNGLNVLGLVIESWTKRRHA